MKVDIHTMEGLLRGKCLPANILVNESLSAYLVRQFDALHDRAEAAERERDELRAQFDKLAEAIGWSKAQCEQTGNSPFDVAEALITSKEENTRRDAAADRVPDYWQFKCVNGDWIGISESGMRQAVSEGIEVRPLYTAPPPAVVSDDALREVIRTWQKAEFPSPEVFNQMREVIGAQPQNPVVLPGYLSYAGIPAEYPSYAEEIAHQRGFEHGVKRCKEALDAANVPYEVKK